MNALAGPSRLSAARIAQGLAPLRRRRSIPCSDRCPRVYGGHSASYSTTISKDKPLVVLGLESSADDSCCAIVDSDRRILANVVVKQHGLNAKYGGIHPLHSQTAHEGGVPLAIRQALAQARISMNDVDAIAYTRGPGIYGCLSISAASAKALAAASGKPLYGVHHMQAHALTPLLTERDPPQFPFLVLLVSGGHTQLAVAAGMDRFRIIADKLDNSIGTAFDKAARALQLPISTSHGAGAVLEQYASLPPLPPYDTMPLSPFPVPLASARTLTSSTALSHDGRDPISSGPTAAVRTPFSFSGLLAHTQRVIETERNRFTVDMSGETGTGMPEEALQREVAKRFQAAAVGHLLQQVKRAIGRYASVSGLRPDDGSTGANASLPPLVKPFSFKGFVASGGVASNHFLRNSVSEILKKLNPESPIRAFYPPIELCTDNAAMIAWTAILRIQAGAKGEEFDLPIRSKWSLEDLYDDVD